MSFGQESHVVSVSVEEELPQTNIRPFALKTNLLFDAATILNAEIEIPVGKKLSLSADFMFPWWLWESRQHALQVNSADLELRYWMHGHHEQRLNGWFVGLHAGAGLYDLEWNRKGYQGEYFIATGISGGYVVPLSRNFNMEFSIGAGYLKTNYRKYNARQDADNEWHLIKQHEGNFSWIGPTKLKVSLVWFPRFKRKGGKP